MVQASENNWSARIMAAARLLIEGEMADPAAGRFSRIVFAVDEQGDPAFESCLFNSALKSGIGVVALRPGCDATSTPRRANIALVDDGAPLMVRDCVLWSAEGDEAIVLVPFDARENYHFGVGPNGLERRTGRPATMLGQGMSRAKMRLERTARGLRREELGSSVTIRAAADVA